MFQKSNNRIKDFTGKIWGTLKAIKATPHRKDLNGSFIWEFKCIKCKKQVFKIPSELNKKSCCGSVTCRLGFSLKDLTGRTFGRLTVSNFAGTNDANQVTWNCICSCGNKRVLITTKLSRGITQSCGCASIERSTKPPGEVSRNTKWSKFLIQSCKERGLVNEFTKAEFFSIISLNCFYCNAEPRLYSAYQGPTGKIKQSYKINQIKQDTIDRSSIKVNGIDRVDNKIGYTKNNCVPCCWDCNKIKSDYTIYEWLSFIEKFKIGFTEHTVSKLKEMGISLPSKID